MPWATHHLHSLLSSYTKKQMHAFPLIDLAIIDRCQTPVETSQRSYLYAQLFMLMHACSIPAPHHHMPSFLQLLAAGLVLVSLMQLFQLVNTSTHTYMTERTPSNIYKLTQPCSCYALAGQCADCMHIFQHGVTLLVSSVQAHTVLLTGLQYAGKGSQIGVRAWRQRTVRIIHAEGHAESVPHLACT